MRELFMPVDSGAEEIADNNNPLEKEVLVDFIHYTFPASMEQEKYDYIVQKIIAEFITPVLWVDMDGVLAKWNPDAKWSDMCNPKTHYFAHCEPDKKVIESIKRLLDNSVRNYEIAICSKVIGPEQAMDKSLWLAQHGLANIKKLFIPYNEKKPICKKDFLLDDYTKNLKEINGTGVKFYNGINGNNGTWTGYAISHQMNPGKAAFIIDSIIKFEAAA